MSGLDSELARTEHKIRMEFWVESVRLIIALNEIITEFIREKKD